MNKQKTYTIKSLNGNKRAGRTLNRDEEAKLDRICQLYDDNGLKYKDLQMCICIHFNCSAQEADLLMDYAFAGGCAPQKKNRKQRGRAL